MVDVPERGRRAALDWAAGTEASKRSLDAAGYMHVDASHISKEAVNDYYGFEIPGSDEAGLDPERKYRVYRPGAELAKAAKSFDGLPILIEHWDDTADDPKIDKRVGATGTDGAYREPYLDNSLHIQDSRAIKLIESGRFKQVSCSYLYDPVFQPGVFDGERYDLHMSNIRGLHVALVPEGRAGPDVAVADSKPETKGNVMSKIEDLLRRALGLARRGAADEDPEPVPQDEGPLEAAPAAEPPAAVEDPAAELAALLDGLADQEAAGKIKAVLERLLKPAGDQEPEEPPADEEPEAEAAAPAEPPAGGEPPKAADRRAPARAAAVKTVDAAAIEAKIKRDMTVHHKAMVLAANDVRPLCGAVDPLGFEDAAAIYRHGLTAAGHVATTSDAAALRDMALMVAGYRKPGAQPRPTGGTADSDLASNFAHLKNIKTRRAGNPGPIS